MFLLIDNYDSFTYNLFHFLGELGAEIEVRRNDKVTAEEAVTMKPQGIILSPGPCDPDRAGVCLPLTALAAEKNIPLLGVCLGHQTIGQVFSGKVVRAPEPMHGKLSAIHHEGASVFRGLPNPIQATRYHSLTVEAIPEDVLAVTARTQDGVVMGLAHKTKPIHGVQFHPESIASEHGHDLLRNFLDLAGGTKPKRKAA
ncbi:MAG: aminodeoxychorismate/anthranilate synthase component II [Alphaproteobacteria bacterium]|nr:aminodeoxychorismate/anthranilate synthase component II [Alphaproteobacteria bacterium]